MSVLLLFVDGIGIGVDNARVNPFVRASMPTMRGISGGRPWLTGYGPWQGERGFMLPTDARLGMPGRPQSASGQAALITGRNAPQLIGEHYGPKPNAALRRLLRDDNLFQRLARSGRRAAQLEAYPPAFHAAIARGKRLPASLQYAALAAGLKLRDGEDLQRGAALPGDFTGAAWRAHFAPDFAPLSPKAAGRRLAQLARAHDFSVFAYWWTDVAGHRGDIAAARAHLELLDAVLAGALAEWDAARDTLILASDHGNMEALDHRRHTENPVPTLVYGAGRGEFAAPLSLTDIAPAVERVLGIAPPVAPAAAS